MLKTALAALLLCGTLTAVEAPACGMVAGWSPQGAPRLYTTDNLYEYMDGNSEGYFLYSFRTMRGVTCLKDDITLVIDISEFADPDSSYGMFCANRDLRLPSEKIGMGGQIVPRRAVFTKGPYYVEIAANPEGDYTGLLRQWSAAIERTLEGATDPPQALQWFPTANQQSLRLVPESPLGIRILKKGYVAEYPNGKAFVIIESDPESAGSLMARLRSRFNAGGTDRLETRDQYLGTVVIFRKGRYVAGAVGETAHELAHALEKNLP